MPAFTDAQLRYLYGYEELNEEFTPDTFDAWTTKSLTPYGVLPNRAVTVWCSVTGFAPTEVGVRSVGSSDERKLKIDRPISNQGFMYPQEDSLFQEMSGRDDGAEDDGAFTPTVSGAWTTYNVTANHGVPAGSAIQIWCAHTSKSQTCSIGVRKVGSSYNRRITIKRVESAGEIGYAVHVKVDDDGNIQYYSSTSSGEFRILGHWNTRYDFVELWYTKRPTTAGSWQTATFASIPSNTLFEAIGVHYASKAVDFGLQTTDWDYSTEADAYERVFTVYNGDTSRQGFNCINLMCKTNDAQQCDFYIGNTTLPETSYSFGANFRISGYWVGKTPWALDWMSHGVDDGICENNKWDQLTVPPLNKTGVAKDFMFVVDVSGSMGGAKINEVVTHATEFLGLLSETDGNKVGFVTFETDAHLRSALTSNLASIQTWIDLLPSMIMGVTNLNAGLNVALNELIANGRADADWEIIVFSDGDWNTGSNPVTNSATVAVALGVTIHTVVYGGPDSTLQAIADMTGGLYLIDPVLGDYAEIASALYDPMPNAVTLFQCSHNADTARKIGVKRYEQGKANPPRRIYVDRGGDDLDYGRTGPNMLVTLRQARVDRSKDWIWGEQYVDYWCDDWEDQFYYAAGSPVWSPPVAIGSVVARFPRGENGYTITVNTNASGNIEYYAGSDLAGIGGHVKFRVLGYYGSQVEFVEKWVLYTPTVSSSTVASTIPWVESPSGHVETVVSVKATNSDEATYVCAGEDPTADISVSIANGPSDPIEDIDQVNALTFMYPADSNFIYTTSDHLNTEFYYSGHFPDALELAPRGDLVDSGGWVFVEGYDFEYTDSQVYPYTAYYTGPPILFLHLLNGIAQFGNKGVSYLGAREYGSTVDRRIPVSEPNFSPIWSSYEYVTSLSQDGQSGILLPVANSRFTEAGYHGFEHYRDMGSLRSEYPAAWRRKRAYSVTRIQGGMYFLGPAKDVPVDFPNNLYRS